MQEFEAAFKRQKELRNEIVTYLREKDLTYEEALKALKDALSYLERASLGNKI